MPLGVEIYLRLRHPYYGGTESRAPNQQVRQQLLSTSKDRHRLVFSEGYMIVC